MYRKTDEYNLELKSGTIGSDLKLDSKSFNDNEQLECYLNKQILIKKKKGYEYT